MGSLSAFSYILWPIDNLDLDLKLCICFNKALFVVWANIDHIKDENDKLFSGFLWTNVKL